MIRVLLVDDDPLYRESLRQLLTLAPDVEVVGEASSAEDACRVGRALRPEVVLIDADLPRAACIEAVHQLAGDPDRSVGGPWVICLAVYPDQHDAAIQAGADRFLRKDASLRELLAAVRAVASGRSAAES